MVFYGGKKMIQCSELRKSNFIYLCAQFYTIVLKKLLYTLSREDYEMIKKVSDCLMIFDT